MKIESGKTYRTRDGALVHIVDKWSDNPFNFAVLGHFVADRTVSMWSGAGHWNLGAGEHGHDLVEAA